MNTSSWLYFIYPLDALGMIALPVGLGLYLARRLGLRWRLFGVGMASFVASQIVHLPLNAALATPLKAASLPLQAVVLGLSAGLCEEGARYLIYLGWIKSARTWREALMFGAGHGGIEAILLGLLVVVAFAQMVALRGADLEALPLTSDQRALVAQQVAAFWSARWYDPLLGVVERASALCAHLALSVMVLQTFRRRHGLWLGAAMVWHAALDAASVFFASTWGIYWTEAVVGAFALASLGIIFALKASSDAPAPQLVPSPPPVAPAPAVGPNPETGADLERKIDESRFTQ